MKSISKPVIDELKKAGVYDKFNHVMVCAGDKDLLSSCNDEYSFDVDDLIITNGIVNHTLQRANNGNEVIYNTAVRGATFVIFYKQQGDVGPELNLYIDEPRYLNTVLEIKTTLDRLDREGAWQDMQTYIKQWRANKEFLIENHQLL